MSIVVPAKGEVLASAQRYEFTGILDQRPVKIWGIGDLFGNPALHEGTHGQVLLERLLDDAGRVPLDSDDVLYCRSDVF